MSTPPQVNGRLTAVSSPEFNEDYDRTASQSSPKWSGESGIYVREKIISQLNAQGALDRVTDTRLYLDSDLLPAVEAGDTVSYTYEGQAYTGKVQDIIAPRLAGTADYMTIMLEEVNAT